MSKTQSNSQADAGVGDVPPQAAPMTVSDRVTKIARDHGDLPLYDPENMQALLIEVVEEKLAALEAEIREEAVAAIQTALGIKGWQMGIDFFDSADDASLYAYHSTDPVAELDSVCGRILQKYGHRWQTIAMDVNLDPKSVARIATTLAARKSAGVFATVKTQVETNGDFDALMNRLIEHPLAKNTTGYDRIQTFVGQVKSADGDRDGVAPRSCLGGCLGVQARTNKIHAAEIGAQDRGGMGVLRRLEVIDDFLEEERLPLIEKGLTPLRSWTTVAPAVIAGNQTLLDNRESRYQFANCVNLLSQLMAEFYVTTEHHLLESARRTRPVLDAELGVMKGRLDALVEEGWLDKADISVNAKKLTLAINFLIVPPLPVSRIDMVFIEQ
jgi:hypothetical protein